MSRGATQNCERCGVKLKMRAAFICEPCYRIDGADDIAREQARRAALERQVRPCEADEPAIDAKCSSTDRLGDAHAGTRSPSFLSSNTKGL